MRSRVAPTGLSSDGKLNASAECRLLYGEVTGFELNHLQLLPLHQVTVDTYGAQHAGQDGRSIRTAYALVGLHLALDRGLSGDQVRAAHQRMGKPQTGWPAFMRPSDLGRLTVLDVARAGGRAGSVEGHAAAIAQWAEDVWSAWSGQHAVVSALTERLLRDFLARLPRE